jgi:Reverse transcriptase (RNA-dependent DNA polymerase)
MQARKKEIPKDGGKKIRVLSIPAIRDRVVQGALKLILEPIYEADFQSGSFGYRPKRTAHEAVGRVARAIVEEKTCIIDLDLASGEGDRQTAARGVRKATRCGQRGQESDGGSEEGRELCFSGFSVSAHTQLSAEGAAIILRAQAEEADSAV